MRRNLLILASVLSLLLCLTLIVAGVWAMRGIWSVDCQTGGWQYSINGSAGKVRAGRQRGFPHIDGTRPASPPTMSINWSCGNWIAVRAGHQDFLARGAVYRQWSSVVELSALAPIALGTTGLLLALGVTGIGRARRRRPTSSCARCAYDLTGNTSGVCPECGTAITAKAGA